MQTFLATNYTNGHESFVLIRAIRGRIFHFPEAFDSVIYFTATSHTFARLDLPAGPSTHNTTTYIPASLY